ncbi:elongation factor 1 [Nesidiocoris tenuis]|uniref:Elongation factor 1 n=1 Tax=Nesidiocoris tenuis TaxID=355587 RepID=A0ABN7B9A5_9HEMI|nr:elongation factor 1 [Nesidiocoris tenuis]
MGALSIDSSSSMSSAEQKAFEKQWTDYSSIYVKNINNIGESLAVLRELNGWLSSHSFLAGTAQTSVDRLIFDQLYDQIASLNYSEKESLIHLSRWYNTIQMSSKLKKSPVHFSRSLLY